MTIPLWAVGFAVGIVAGWFITLRLYPHPLSPTQMRRRKLMPCPMCQGVGCFNDVSATHGQGVHVPAGDLPPGGPQGILDPRLRAELEADVDKAMREP